MAKLEITYTRNVAGSEPITVSRNFDLMDNDLLTEIAKLGKKFQKEYLARYSCAYIPTILVAVGIAAKSRGTKVSFEGGELTLTAE